MAISRPSGPVAGRWLPGADNRPPRWEFRRRAPRCGAVAAPRL